MYGLSYIYVHYTVSSPKLFFTVCSFSLYKISLRVTEMFLDLAIL